MPHEPTARVEDADAALARAAADGSAEAFSELAARHKGRVLGIAARFTRGWHELEDLGQEIFLRAWEKLRSFRGDAPFEHWISRLAVRRCLDHLRREKHRRAEAELDPIAWTLADDAPDREEEVRAAKELLDRALARLPDEMRLVLTLVELDERPAREVADLTGWSEANVRQRAHRARARLRDVLDEMGEKLP